MIKIKENIEFDETKILQEQSQEFRNWLFENCESKINDKYPVQEWDRFQRPAYYDFEADGFKIKLIPLYLFEDKSTWAISGYKIEIE